jgi:hypothetical protein
VGDGSVDGTVKRLDDSFDKGKEVRNATSVPKKGYRKQKMGGCN